MGADPHLSSQRHQKDKHSKETNQEKARRRRTKKYGIFRISERVFRVENMFKSCKNTKFSVPAAGKYYY